MNFAQATYDLPLLLRYVYPTLFLNRRIHILPDITLGYLSDSQEDQVRLWTSVMNEYVPAIFHLQFSESRRNRTSNVYPKGTDLQSVTTPPSLPYSHLCPERDSHPYAIIFNLGLYTTQYSC